MKDAVFEIDSGTRRRTVRLSTAIDAAIDERAAELEYRWIKRLRLLPVDGQPLRRRFTYRGDSLWWFTELYLHKRRIVLDLFRASAALTQLIERERPVELALVSGDRIVRGVAPQLARLHEVRYRGPSGFGGTPMAIARLDLRAIALAWSALASRLRRPRLDASSAAVAAFVHRAFWRGRTADGHAESYIGPVLEAIERRLPAGALRHVSVGPGANFAARRWWHGLRGGDAAVSPVEGFAPLAALRDSRRLWRDRHRLRRALCSSAAVRQHAIVDGVDWWPLVREELAGVVLLQWTWSARAMDEAGAALEATCPAAAVTYAEAGGWGRALMIECRRRNIPSVGLQHGFIYRHWLNYRHEPDEMAPDPDAPGDRGFPRPDLTLVFDEYAAAHLERSGCFPRDALRVTGSPRLDALVASTRALPASAIEAARRETGATPEQALVVVVTKFREARRALPALIAAAGRMPGVHLAIKAHPAETPEVYGPLVAGRSNARVLPASSPLGPLLAAARAVVTVNSTVALDAGVLGVPALVIGLPNNLSPFVEAGVMAGGGEAEMEAALRRILYDQEFRQQLEASRDAFLARHGIRSDGRAAERSADAILASMEPSRATR